MAFFGICMVCGQSENQFNGMCGACGSNNLIWEDQLPIVRDNEYPTHEELLELRKQGKL